ncbi:MAG: T9SS type A sorting domain-containing protein [Bacteroidetes bacterium]|nr:T9SS type A sorting domain-containing protein [Bacteroidota bacterium]
MAVLEWQTASEINSDYFEIQRSADVLYWQTIGEVKGAGWSADVINYSWTDENPLNGQSYYRLMQVDQDGSLEYLPVRSFIYKSDAVIQVSFANPVQCEFSLELTADRESITNGYVAIDIYNVSGQKVISTQFPFQEGLNLINVPMTEADPGIYFFSASQNHLSFLSDRFILTGQ